MSTILLITSAQRDLLHPEGIAWEMVRETVERNKVPARLKQLLGAARSVGMPVIHSPIALNYHAMAGYEPNSTIQKVIVSARLLGEGSAGAAFIDEAMPVPGEIVLPPRQGFSAFWAKTIQPHLQQLNARTIYLAGMLAEACVESHTRDAVENGFRPVVIRDAIGSTSAAMLNAAEQALAQHAFGVQSTADAVAAWHR